MSGSGRRMGGCNLEVRAMDTVPLHGDLQINIGIAGGDSLRFVQIVLP